MLVTEAEAKTKWCPFVRVALMDGSGSINRDSDAQVFHGEDRCLGSRCMMWRSEPTSRGFGSVQARRRGTERWESWDWNPGDAEQYSDWEFRDKPPNELRGSCGLAK